MVPGVSEDIYAEHGIHVGTFAGPETTPPAPRKRVQLSVLNDDGQRQIMVLTVAQWNYLTDAVIAIDGSGRI